MGWLKNIIIDLLVTALIVVAVTTGQEWARWVVIVYTPIMLILKLASLFGRSTIRQMKSKTIEAPPWALHVLYAVNVVALAAAQWWITAAQWMAIWIISFVQQRQPASRWMGNQAPISATRGRSDRQNQREGPGST